MLGLIRNPRGGRFLDISVGVTVENVEPLGNWMTPGVTKVGRLSFSGWVNGQKVKIYSAHSAEQIKLRVFLAQMPFTHFSLPALVAHNEHLLVEEWVEGESLKPGPEGKNLVCSIVEELHSTTHKLEQSWLTSSPFCYFQDYLVTRLGRWRGVAQIDDFLLDWQSQMDSLKNVLEPRLCHPDLTLPNMIQCSGTGRVMVIDNELLGVGRGWVLDWHNAGWPDQALLGYPDKDELSRFVSLSWKLRRLGSLLDACDYDGVRRLMS